MQRDKEDARVCVELLLRAVAMVHVPVDDEHALHALREKRPRRNRDVVEVAETPVNGGSRTLTLNSL